MGTVLGAFLTRNGFPVDLIDSYPAQVDALNEKGAGVVGCAELTVPVRALLPEQMEGVYDLVFLMVKQTNNEASLRALLPHLGENSTVCTLQNGVPELAVAEFVGRNRTVGGACRWGATFVEPGISELTNALSARTVLFEIGEIDGRITDRIRAVAEVLGHMDNGKVEITDNLMGARWLKLMLNCCMSGLSSALGCTFESVISSEKALACTSYLAAEVVHAARAAGFQLTDTNGLNTAEIADFQTAEELERSKGYIYRNYYPLRTAKASMLQDLERGKKTEIQMINGYVSAMGRKYGVPTPFNDLVVKIITDIEAAVERNSATWLCLSCRSCNKKETKRRKTYVLRPQRQPDVPNAGSFRALRNSPTEQRREALYL